MTRLRSLFALMLIPLLIVGGCAASSSSRPASSTGGAAPPQAAPASAGRANESAPRQAAAGSAAKPTDQQQADLPSADRMIIRTVSMTIAVTDVQETFRQAERIAVEQGGLLAASQVRQDGDRMTATMTIRVPSDSATYQETLTRLRAVAERVVEEQGQAQDITEEYVDLESRLRNLSASEQSLLALLQRAAKIEDIINIQRELTNVRGQIEQIQGRKQALERRADMATITLTIREIGTFSRPGWNPGDTVASAVRALGESVRGLATLGIWLLVFSPIWGGFLLAVWFVGRFLIRRLRGTGPRRTPAPAPAPTASAGPAAGSPTPA